MISMWHPDDAYGCSLLSTACWGGGEGAFYLLPKHAFMLYIYIIYVTLSTSPYKSFNFCSIASIIYNYSSLKTTSWLFQNCKQLVSIRNTLKGYQILNMMTPLEMLNKEGTFSL